jgi:anti-sigma factor RsiW
MSETAPHLTAQEMEELSALADGTLPAERRAAVEARVAASPELRRLLARQRRAVEAARITASEPPPESLRDAIAARVEGTSARRSRARRLAPRLAFAGAVAAAAAVVLAVALSGGPAGPSVADAARLAAKPASGPPPPPLGDSRTKLAVAVDGATFPNLRHSYGWRAVGERQDEVDGRNARVVTYAKGNRRIGYVIVAGPGLPRPTNAPATTRHGVEYQTVAVDGRPAVTWQRVGHTCVLTGSTSPAELLTLAAWQGRGTLHY